mmetsp:Transcript_14334/g.21438  ORF Transcript_14334/g.21438 Transcript_14334/m.21438 type:complete len:318 (-) Transcript_14334:47-1000(-)
MRKAIEILANLIPSEIRDEVLVAANMIGDDIEHYLGDYGLEIEGIAKAAHIPKGLVVLMNLAYELTSACTSIVAQPKGQLPPYHARNLDFGAGYSFTQDLEMDAISVRFTDNTNTTLYSGVTYTGYVGILTGISNVVSVSVDEHIGPLWEILVNVLQAILRRDSQVVSFMIRDTLLSAKSFDQAMHAFQWTPLAAEVYLIVSGPAPQQGAVVTRMRNFPENTWWLNATTAINGWYVLETNWPHWQEAGDHRRATAIAAMNNVTQAAFSNVNSAFDGLWKVLSTEPVLNKLTTYTSLMHVATNQIESYRRHCRDPCPF